MAENAPQIPILVLKPHGQVGALLFTLCQKMEGLSPALFNLFGEIDAYLRQARGGLIFLHLKDKNELTPIVNFIKSRKKEIKDGTCRFVVTTPFNLPALHAKLMEVGCSEVLVEPVSERTLGFKLSRHAQVLGQAMGVSTQAKTQTSLEAGLVSKAASALARSSEVRIGDPLKILSDFWLLKGGGARKVMGRWMINLTGPNTDCGKWERLSGIETLSGEDQWWQWFPNPKSDSLVLEDGSWFFFGHHPELQGEVWLFVSSKPRLEFRFDRAEGGAERIEPKAQVDSSTGSLVIAGDSASGLQMIPAIKATFERVFHRDFKSRKDQDKFSAPEERGATASPQLPVNPAIGKTLASLGEKIAQKTGDEAKAMEAALKKVEKSLGGASLSPMEQHLPPEQGSGNTQDSVVRTVDALSPLAYSYLISEVARLGDWSLERMGDKFCEYLHTTYTNCAIALASGPRGTHWHPIGKAGFSNLSAPSIEQAVQLAEALRTGSEPWEQDEAKVVVGVRGRDPAVLLGAVILLGEGARQVDAQYVANIAEAARGLCEFDEAA